MWAKRRHLVMMGILRAFVNWGFRGEVFEKGLLEELGRAVKDY